MTADPTDRTGRRTDGTSSHAVAPDTTDTTVRAGATALVRLSVALGAGVAVGAVTAAWASWQLGVLAGWMCASALFITWVWVLLWPMDATATAAHALQEDPTRSTTDSTFVVAAVASLGAVAALLLGGSTSTDGRLVQSALGFGSVCLAWATVHTLFATRYARLYYSGTPGDVDFNEDNPPQYSDFAYLAFTLGMTFQVSDTDLRTKAIRATALRQSLLSYLFGVVTITTMINLNAGLAR